jgi:hypothetical protein
MAGQIRDSATATARCYQAAVAAAEAAGTAASVQIAIIYISTIFVFKLSDIRITTSSMFEYGDSSGTEWDTEGTDVTSSDDDEPPDPRTMTLYNSATDWLNRGINASLWASVISSMIARQAVLAAQKASRRARRWLPPNIIEGIS